MSDQRPPNNPAEIMRPTMTLEIGEKTLTVERHELPMILKKGNRTYVIKETPKGGLVMV